MSIQYMSTRGSAPNVCISEAIRNGAAPDGGLYLPEHVPDAVELDPDLSLPVDGALTDGSVTWP